MRHTRDEVAGIAQGEVTAQGDICRYQAGVNFERALAPLIGQFANAGLRRKLQFVGVNIDSVASDMIAQPTTGNNRHISPKDLCAGIQYRVAGIGNPNQDIALRADGDVASGGPYGGIHCHGDFHLGNIDDIPAIGADAAGSGHFRGTGSGDADSTAIADNISVNQQVAKGFHVNPTVGFILNP